MGRNTTQLYPAIPRRTSCDNCALQPNMEIICILKDMCRKTHAFLGPPVLMQLIMNMSSTTMLQALGRCLDSMRYPDPEASANDVAVARVATVAGLTATVWALFSGAVGALYFLGVSEISVSSVVTFMAFATFSLLCILLLAGKYCLRSTRRFSILPAAQTHRHAIHVIISRSEFRLFLAGTST
jgi:hypothetical protein